jgi:hypothetical protein
MSSKAESAALEILKGPSSYNKLSSQLEGEQRELLHKAWMECQILTICQSIWNREQLTCQAWRDSMHELLMNRVKDYNERYGEKR